MTVLFVRSGRRSVQRSANIWEHSAPEIFAAEAGAGGRCDAGQMLDRSIRQFVIHRVVALDNQHLMSLRRAIPWAAPSAFAGIVSVQKSTIGKSEFREIRMSDKV